MNNVYTCIVGSHAYGTNIATSDIDKKGIYIQDEKFHVAFGYEPQKEVGKDETYYEIKRFIELLSSGNPTLLEMLFVDEQFILNKHKCLDVLFENRHKFLTKQLYKSFGGYATQQIAKAGGLNKKMNWEREKTVRKTPLDFCFIQYGNGSLSLNEFLKRENMKQEYCGLSAIGNMPNCYLLYYDYTAQYGRDLNRPIDGFGYRGIVFEESNDIRLSSIPKEQVGQEKGIVYYNKDAYSIHCKEYREYETWLENRNTTRYVDIENHNQRIDGKNMMHCIRLLNSAEEIAQTGNFNVLRPEANDLLKIRRGEIDLGTLITYAKTKNECLKELFNKSNLPDNIDFDWSNNLILEIRKNYQN